MKNIILIKQNKIQKQKLFKSSKNIAKYFFYLAIIELILILTNFIIILSSLFNNNALRKLQYHDYNYQGNSGYTTNNGYNNNNVKKSEPYQPMNPVIIIFFVFFILFLFLCLYIICEIKRIAPEKITEILKDNVYKFIYMTNSGFFFTSICYSPMLKDMSIGYLTLVVSGIIFVIGSIIFIKNLIRDTGGKCCSDFAIFEKLSSYCKLPCDYVWPFIGLTDPCCAITSYEVTTYSDGTTTSNKSCVECWNAFMCILKRVVLIISTILYYCFFIVLFVIFLIIKLISMLFTHGGKCCQSSDQNVNSNIPNNDVIISNNGNLENQQNLGNNGINPNVPKQETTVQQDTQVGNNYIIKNQIQSPNQTSTERYNLNNQVNNNTTKLVIKDGNANNLLSHGNTNQNINQNEIINIKNKEN